ncbi:MULTISPECIES: hypothetical protein [unclassified Paenarthrobacter]|uniref:hypothetical protein n=1 Tax=unclassified Paenarthrobacter TaxID=2634190 RepID=UPI003CEA4A2D
MPFQAHPLSETNTPALPQRPGVPVVPGVDVVRGTVTLFLDGRLQRFLCADAHRMERALGQAVRPTRWCSAMRTLTVTVAAVGQPRGRERHFLLSDMQD